MKLHKLIFTENDCYKAGQKITPKGIMVHSTGANNPNLRRYVGPDDGLLGRNIHNNHWNMGGIRKCVHAFIGQLADGGIACYQTLPWNHRGWHAGGAANNTHISFEICEAALTDRGYFNEVYPVAVDLCVLLCKEFNLTEKDIIGHYEGRRLGIASNHADPGHWFPRHGKSMDIFRADVKAKLNPPIDENIYIVKRGDTLSRIAENYPCTWQEIAAYNNLKNPNLLQVGQRLRIPSTTPVVPSPAPPTVYTVKRGDSLYRIARGFPGVSWAQIAKENNIPTPYILQVGQKLRIPNVV